jgi:uncharacterized protein YdeI (YjbR/CyaY-like superfamily)
MPPHIVKQDRIKPFPTEAAFEEWLAAHHATEKEVWIRIYKTGSGVPTITPVQATDVALCWGWIDGVRKSLDETSFLQRYTPRRPMSAWSQIHGNNVARLTSAGRMTPHGLRHVDLAMADGRLDAAAAPRRNAAETLIPADLRAAIDAAPRALETFKRLSHPNVLELAARTNGVKTASGRAKKIAELVALLAAGGTLVPEPVPERAAPEGVLPLPKPAPPKRPAPAVAAKLPKTKAAAPRQPTVAKAKPAKTQAAAPKRPAPAKAKAKPAKTQAAASKRPAPAKAKAKPAKTQAATPKRPAPAKAKAKPAKAQAATPKRPAPAKAKAKPAKTQAATPKRPPPARATRAAKKAGASELALKAKAKKKAKSR